MVNKASNSNSNIPIWAAIAWRRPNVVYVGGEKRKFDLRPKNQWRSQPDSLVMLWKFKWLSLFISLEIDSLYGLKTQKYISIAWLASLQQKTNYQTDISSSEAPPTSLCVLLTTQLRWFIFAQDMFVIFAKKRNQAQSNLIPRLFLRGRKDPGWSWSRDLHIKFRTV